MRSGLSREETQQLAESAASNSEPRASGWWRANCPFCIYRVGKDDTSKVFSVEKTEGWFKCWRCGVKGRLDSVPYEMVEEAASRQKENYRDPSKPPDGFISIGEGRNASSITIQPALRYLEKRGLDLPLIRELRVGCVADGYYNGRVVVPVLTDDGRHWLGWIARAWTRKSKGPPYLSAPGMQRGELLYNHSALFEDTDEPIAVVEGVFDAFPLWPDAVSTLGLSGGRRDGPGIGGVVSRGIPTDHQLEALLASKRPVVLVLDGDAFDEGWAMSQLLRAMGRRAGAVKLPPMTDPDEVDPDWLRRKMRDSLG